MLTLVFIHFKRLVILNVHDVKNQSINEQERAVWVRLVNNILYNILHKKTAEMQFEGMNISLLHMYRVYLPLPELYRKCCANFIKYIWDIGNKVQ